jgi:hypothetical protein
MSIFLSLLLTLRSCARSRVVLQLEVLALRHQLQVLQRSRPQRLRLTQADRWLWIWLSRVWNEWRAALVIVKPETVIAWHRRAFRAFWRWRSHRRLGRPSVPRDVRALIRSMSTANPRWGAPRIHGELLKLGVDLCQATVVIRKYYVRTRTRPSRRPFQSVLVMEPAQDRPRRDATADRKTMAMRLFGNPLRRWIRNVGPQAGVWPSAIVMSNPFLKNSAKMPVTQGDQPIQALSTNRADQPFAMSIRLR